MKTISRYIMTLALLLTAVTGAWAVETTVTWVTTDFYNTGSAAFTKYDVTVTPSNNDARHSNYFYKQGANTFTTTLGNFTKIEIVFMPSSSPLTVSGWDYEVIEAVQPEPEYDPDYWEYTSKLTWTGDAESVSIQGLVESIKSITFTIAEPLTVAWDATTKTGTFLMPGSDVVLTPIYAKAAAFATTGTEPEVKTLLPEAAEGVIAGTDASLIADGTGIVAFAAASTEVKQGTLMYAIGTSATQAPELTDFSATVPTAKNVADDGADVYVWYYIKGADTPDGEAATLDNTFDDTEPACLTVTVLSNKFDIQFNAANANTIEAGKATVTVDGTAATVTEGKLQGVKMGSEVKLKANTGYKFRKVEVKKKEAAPSLSITNPEVGQVIGSDGKNYDADATLPSGVTAVAKICYVSGSNGLALALTDEEGKMVWSTAQTTCAAHTPAFTGGTWKLATKDEWDNMISAAGSYEDLRDGFSSVGGTNMQHDYYWSSTEDGSDDAWCYRFNEGVWLSRSKGDDYRVRACLAF